MSSVVGQGGKNWGVLNWDPAAQTFVDCRKEQVMVRVNARYVQGQLVLEQPLDLPEGTEVVIEIHAVAVPQIANPPVTQLATDEQQAWELACSRFEEEWDLADPS